MVATVIVGEHTWAVAATIEVTDGEAEMSVRRRTFKATTGRVIAALETYCYGGDVRYMTPDGPKDFESTVGTKQFVLTQHFNEGSGSQSRTDGRWVEAEIEAFGESPVRTVTLTRDKITKTIKATPNHRWFASRYNSTNVRPHVLETDDLRPGMVLASLTTRFAPRQSIPSPFGIAHGVVFGDGSRVKRAHGGEGAMGSRIDLWGDKNTQLLRYFNDSPSRPVKTPSGSGVEGIHVAHLPSFFKDCPPLDESVSYLYGWLAGYFAADGCVSSKGLAALSSARRDNLEFVQKVCLRLGMITTSITSTNRLGYGSVATPLYRLGFFHSTLRPEFFLIQEHRDRFVAHTAAYDRIRWTVVSVEDHGEVEPVYCAEVPDTHSFALEDYIWTHNCLVCRKEYEVAAGTVCEVSQVHKGGPIDTRKRRQPEAPVSDVGGLRPLASGAWQTPVDVRCAAGRPRN